MLQMNIQKDGTVYYSEVADVPQRELLEDEKDGETV